MRILLALAVLALAVSPLSATQTDEENAIREIQARWDDAWNRHDVKALSLNSQPTAAPLEEEGPPEGLEDN